MSTYERKYKRKGESIRVRECGSIRDSVFLCDLTRER